MTFRSTLELNYSDIAASCNQFVIDELVSTSVINKVMQKNVSRAIDVKKVKQTIGQVITETAQAISAKVAGGKLETGVSAAIAVLVNVDLPRRIAIQVRNMMRRRYKADDSPSSRSECRTNNTTLSIGEVVVREVAPATDFIFTQVDEVNVTIRLPLHISLLNVHHGTCLTHGIWE